jgi:uncharacterized protein (DUF1330 family)
LIYYTRPMIYLTQLIYINEGQEQAFHTFEEVAIPLIAKYDGKLLMRYRPGAEDVIEGTMERPYEIHLVNFATDASFQAFLKDEERKKVMHLKEQSVREVLLIKGGRI